MRKCSDHIQDLAMAYGERNTMEQSILMLEEIDNDTNRNVMEVVFRVFGIDCLTKSLGFYLRQKSVN